MKNIIILKKQTEKCTSIKYVLFYLIIYQFVSVASATINRVSYTNTNYTQTIAKMSNCKDPLL